MYVFAKGVILGFYIQFHIHLHRNSDYFHVKKGFTHLNTMCHCNFIFSLKSLSVK